MGTVVRTMWERIFVGVECSVTCSRVVNVPMGVYGYGGSAATPIPFDSSPRLNLTLVVD